MDDELSSRKGGNHEKHIQVLGRRRRGAVPGRLRVPSAGVAGQLSVHPAAAATAHLYDDSATGGDHCAAGWFAARGAVPDVAQFTRVAGPWRSAAISHDPAAGADKSVPGRSAERATKCTTVVARAG